MANRPPSSPPPAGGDQAWSALPDPLRSHLLLYRLGFFPMARGRDDEFQWYTVSRRAIIPLDDSFHVPRRLAKKLRSRPFDVRFDQAFDEVLAACADRPETWMSEGYMSIYRELHRHGVAHSVEAWERGELVGGLYGIAMGGAFFGESMFSRATDASKACLVALVERLRERRFEILDAQIANDHTARFGTFEVSRERFLDLLERALELDRSFHPPAGGEAAKPAAIEPDDDSLRPFPKPRRVD